MPDTYCVQCGAVNQIGYQYCVGCGSHLASQPTYAAPAGSVESESSEWTTDEPHGWQPFRDPSKPLPGIHTFNVGDVLGWTLRHFAKRLWLITKIVFLVVAPFEVFQVLRLDQSPQDWQTIWIGLLLGALCNV